MAAACHPSRSAPPPPGAPAVAVATPSTSGMQRAEDFAVEQAMRLEQEVINLKSQLAIERRRGLPAESAKHERERRRRRAAGPPRDAEDLSREVLNGRKEIRRLRRELEDHEVYRQVTDAARARSDLEALTSQRDEAQKEARRATRLYRERRDRDRRAKEDELRREAAAAKDEARGRSEGRGPRKVVVKYPFVGNRRTPPPGRKPAFVDDDADESPRPRHLAPTASARSPYLAPQLRKKPANHPQNRAAKKRPTNGGFK
ncbi:hypothetical protein JL722_2530 [Aureococcus anophagefferens]|nr:hypothetical protein JL722_2530 [Aureococcus anophagefferens]